MTVSELIEQLKEMPQDAKIVMMFMDEIRSIRYHDFGGLSEENVVQLNSYEEKNAENRKMVTSYLGDRCEE